MSISLGAHRGRGPVLTDPTHPYLAFTWHGTLLPLSAPRHGCELPPQDPGIPPPQMPPLWPGGNTSPAASLASRPLPTGRAPPRCYLLSCPSPAEFPLVGHATTSPSSLCVYRQDRHQATGFTPGQQGRFDWHVAMDVVLNFLVPHFLLESKEKLARLILGIRLM